MGAFFIGNTDFTRHSKRRLARSTGMAKGDLVFDLRVASDAAIRDLDTWVNHYDKRTLDLSNRIQRNFGGPEIVQKVVLQTVTDETGAKRQIPILKEFGRLTDQINQQFVNANKLQDGSVSRLRQQVNEAKQARDAIAKIGKSADDLKNKVNSVNPAWDLANQKVKSLSRELEIASASSFWQKIKAELNLGPIVGAGKALNEIVNTFQSLSIVVGQLTAPIIALSNALNDIQQIDLTFKGIGAGPADISKVFADSSAIALKYGVNLKTVREGFTQLSPVILASGGTMDDVSDITSALSSRFATFGLSADKSKRVMNGVIQAFGKGKLMAEELTQQISEADPAFKTDLANAIGVTVSQLGEMVKAGEITSQVLMDVIPLLGKSSTYFGGLGDSATSAVMALARGQATIEQVKNQLATLNQLNLEGFARLFQPLLGAFVQVQAAVTDFITNLRGLESTKFVINIINNLATTLATVVTAFTNAVIAVAKIVEPIFAAANAIDKFTKKLFGVEVVAGAIALAITGVLAKSLYGLAITAIPRVITALSGLNASFAILNAQSIIGFVRSIGTAIASTVTAIATFGKNIAANFAVAASYKKTEVAALASARAKVIEANAGNLASMAAAKNIAALKGVEASLDGVEAASKGAAGGFKIGASGAIALAAAMVPVAYAYNTYKTISDAGTQAGEAFDEQLKGIRAEFAQFSAGAANASDDAERFANELKRLSEQPRKRDFFDIVVDVVFMTDMNTALAILKAKAELNKRFKSLQNDIGGTRKRLDEYNAAQDQGGKKAAYLKAEVESQIKALDALRQQAIQTRNELAKKAASSGKTLDPKEVIALNKFQEDIKKFEAARDKLIADSAAKGIVVDAKLQTSGEEQAITTITGLKEQLKTIQEGTTTAKIGEQGTEETQNKIKGLDGLLQFIEENPVIVKIKAQFDIDKANIASQIEYAGALLDYTKSRGTLEDSIFDVVKSRNSFAVKTAEEELKSLQERKAGAGVIKQKEAEIAQLKENERNIEKQAIQNKLAKIGEEQTLQKTTLSLKQQGQRIEAEALIDTAKRLVKEAEIAEQIAIQNYLKAQGTKDPTDDEPASKLVDLAGEYVDFAEKGVTSAVNRYQTLLKTQDLETKTLENQQAAERNTLNAQAAQLGLNSYISEGATNYRKIVTESAGYISAGGQTIQLTREFAQGLDTAAGNAQALGEQVGNIPTDQSFNVDVRANVNPQSVGTSLAEGQSIINQPGNALTAQIKSYLEPTDFYNEVQRAKQAIQSTDAMKVVAQLDVQGANSYGSAIISIRDQYTKYKLAVESVQIATDQVATAQQQYNNALASGDPGSILSAAGALQAQNDALYSAKAALTSVTIETQKAAAEAEALGLTFGGLSPVAETAATSAAQIGQSLLTGSEQATQLNNSLYGTSTAVESIGTSVGLVNQDIEAAGTNISESWTGAIDSASESVQGLVQSIAGVTTEVGYATGSIQGLEEATGGTAEGLGSAVENADALSISAEGISEQFSAEGVDAFATALDGASSSAQGITDSNFSGAAEEASVAGSSFNSSLQSASTEADAIYSTLSNLDGLNPTVTVNVVGTPGRFAGGPVDSGSLYRVNELGKEAFLSASGRLSMINKPRNALWRAPSSGTVIPAHLTAGLNIPSNGVRMASGASRRVSAAVSNMSSSASIARAVTQALKASGLLETNNNAAANQAGQAMQLGKLTHAVNKLVDKDWNVQVNVKNPNPAAYVNMINRLS